jgi:hypothetical protein
MLKKLFLVLLIFTGISVYADTWYTITVRGLNKDLPFLAWQMTYKIKAVSQREAEQTAKSKAEQDGCVKDSAYIVEITAVLEPGKEQSEPATIIINQPPPVPEPSPPTQSPAQSETTTVIITEPKMPPAQEKTDIPAITYDESYRAGYDHGVTGFLTNRDNYVVNDDIPEKYRQSEQVQAYKNGYARGFADEKEKADAAVEAKRPQPVQPVYPNRRNPSPR